MKFCGYCEKFKGLSEFSKKSASRDGYSNKCKACHNEYVRTKWYPENRKKHISSVTSYKKLNHYKTLSHKYKIPEEIIKETMLKGFCEICGSTDNLVFDHIHSTNTARGCLCNLCNIMLGRIGDTNEDILKMLLNIIPYVSKL